VATRIKVAPLLCDFLMLFPLASRLRRGGLSLTRVRGQGRSCRVSPAPATMALAPSIELDRFLARSVRSLYCYKSIGVRIGVLQAALDDWQDPGVLQGGRERHGRRRFGR
jgi:hypothetical protein